VRGDRIIAYGVLMLAPGEAQLLNLSVVPEARRQGLGRALLAAAEDHARSDLKAGRLEMTVIAQRAELIGWYERRGYSLTGERRPFPMTDARFGLPKRGDLEFVVVDGHV